MAAGTVPLDIPTEPPRVLVVDDEKSIRTLLEDFLSMDGYAVETAEDGRQALDALETHPFDIVLSDMKMPRMGGLELLTEMRQRQYDVTPIIMTGYGTVETAIQAMKTGAYDYLLKPFRVEEVSELLERVMTHRRLVQENFQLKEITNLLTVSDAINSTLSLREILDVVVETTLTELDCDAVCLAVRNPLTHQFDTPLWRGQNDMWDGEDFGALNYDALLDRVQVAHSVAFTNHETQTAFTTPPDTGLPTAFLAVPLISRDEITGLLAVYTHTPGFRYRAGQTHLLTLLAGKTATAIANGRLYEQLEDAFQETIQGFVSALEAKDPYTSGHSKRVTDYAILAAQGLGLDRKTVQQIGQAGLLHDIGKIGIRVEALNKPGKLTPDEYEMFKQHPQYSKNILEPIHFLSDIVPWVYYHHECMDGSGYPTGIAGDEIPVGARIICVVDSFDAMTSDRAYRRSLTRRVAFDELRKCSETQFDSAVVKAFIEQLTRVENTGTTVAAAAAPVADTLTPLRSVD